MPAFLSKIATFSLYKENCWSMSGFIAVKNLLLLINFLCMLAGLILIGAGGYLNTLQSQDDLLVFSSQLSIAAIVIGVIVALISFLGCFGAANEKGMLLKTYFSLLVILIILQMSIGISAFALRDQVPTLLSQQWEKRYNRSAPSILKVQDAFKCCGFYNITDRAGVPANVTDQTCTQYNKAYTVPCYQTIVDTFNGNLNNIGNAGVVMGVLEIVGVICSVVLFKKIAKREQTSQSLMNDAWRINRSKIQYGYQNYDYI